MIVRASLTNGARRHRLAQASHASSRVSLNARGKPLESLEVIINLIAATTTTTGLKVYARLDKRDYPRA